MTFDMDTSIKGLPWQLIIRARYVDEIDALLASIIAARVAQVASAETAHAVASAAQRAGRVSQRREASAEQRVAAFEAIADWEDNWCWTWPHPWPGPRFDDVSDALAGMVMAHAAELVKVGGSEQLQVTLGAALSTSQPGRQAVGVGH